MCARICVAAWWDWDLFPRHVESIQLSSDLNDRQRETELEDQVLCLGTEEADAGSLPTEMLQEGWRDSYSMP